MAISTIIIEDRKRKLLVARKIKSMTSTNAWHKKALTLIPTMLYFKDSRVKCEIALAKGKKLYDKRDASAKKDSRTQNSTRINTTNDATSRKLLSATCTRLR
jgi:SsrA-binding protein